MQVALVSRSLAPFGGGGIGEYVDTTARILSGAGHDVTIFTTEGHRAAYDELRAGGDPDRLLAPAAEYVFVRDAAWPEGFYTPLHRYSSAVFDAIVDRYPGGGPDLIEVSDYLGEGFVLAQARATHDPRVADSLLAVRLHTTAELCAVLDGHHDTAEFSNQVDDELERFALRHADLLLWPGGDVLGLYERFYGAERLAPAVQIRNPLLLGDGLPDDTDTVDRAGPLKLLYIGRLERRKGVQNLLRAVTALGDPAWRLTLLGGDTETAPLGGSMRSQLELMAAEDERIEFLDHVPRAQLGDVISRHDVVVLPSLWECWPYVALEAMRRNRPVLATPTGGFTELVRPGVNGWFTADTTAEALSDAIAQLLADREAARRPRREGGPRDTVLSLAHPDEVVERYATLHEERRPRPLRRARAARPAPLVSVVIPYYGMSEFIEDTVRSVVAQTYPEVETLIVNDGSFGEADRILEELAVRYPLTVLSQPNAGLGAARNFGVAQARGRYVLPLDADNMIAPAFIERCVDVLESDRRLAYVTSWSRYVDERGEPTDELSTGYQPLGNETELIVRDNVAGDAAAVIRHRIFDLGFAYSQDLTSYEDWHFYLELHRAGHHGLVIPERLLDYRVRRDSMIREIGLPQTARLVAEINAHVLEKEIAWTPRNV
ncbi:glycosyltransferase [Conexibacter woesei]|uniref:Glycosyl transferase group 1 n=1 Tax=Conexibacter woesei (strain DSM 14684 / CCUG 47730 / CIP 108061 / JCM 11494 / NBRC 100937 / ID131577) TaxID=469383 RepID=D3EZM6_CONWI|nr:glycosyltransferase [Conexibacter woesei]ADB53864.1 glycosyl transferase group 1 [Conexibacter woesei DSM 14684]